MTETKTITVAPTTTAIVLRDNQHMKKKLRKEFKPWKSNKEKETKVGVFTIKSANETIKAASKERDPLRLYDEFWIENEVCCLFADSNVGKSILAVQIAKEVAKNQKVLYFDFELSDKQFQLRYTDDKTKQLYEFPKNLQRVCMNKLRAANPTENLAEKIIQDIEKCVRVSKCKTIIIDNLTWISSNSRSTKIASDLMKRLSIMQEQYKLSMLILAHTTKRNMSKPITQNDLGGSKMIFNFLDSAFSIGVSAKDPNVKFIKQVKVRDGALKYGTDNVMLCTIEKKNSFLQLVTIGYDEENEHLKKQKNDDKIATIARIKAMKAEGMTIRDIAKELGMSPATVDRWSKK